MPVETLKFCNALGENTYSLFVCNWSSLPFLWDSRCMHFHIVVWILLCTQVAASIMEQTVLGMVAYSRQTNAWISWPFSPFLTENVCQALEQAAWGRQHLWRCLKDACRRGAWWHGLVVDLAGLGLLLESIFSTSSNLSDSYWVPLKQEIQRETEISNLSQRNCTLTALLSAPFAPLSSPVGGIRCQIYFSVQNPCLGCSLSHIVRILLGNALLSSLTGVSWNFLLFHYSAFWDTVLRSSQSDWRR